VEEKKAWNDGRLLTFRFWVERDEM